MDSNQMPTAAGGAIHDGDHRAPPQTHQSSMHRTVASVAKSATPAPTAPNGPSNSRLSTTLTGAAARLDTTSVSSQSRATSRRSHCLSPNSFFRLPLLREQIVDLFYLNCLNTLHSNSLLSAPIKTLCKDLIDSHLF